METDRMNTAKAKVLAQQLSDWAAGQAQTQETLIFDVIGRAFALTAETGAKGFIADWKAGGDIPCSGVKRLRGMDLPRPISLYSREGENGI